MLRPRPVSWSGRKQPHCLTLSPSAGLMLDLRATPMQYESTPFVLVCLSIYSGGLGLPRGQRSENFFLKG